MGTVPNPTIVLITRWLIIIVMPLLLIAVVTGTVLLVKILRQMPQWREEQQTTRKLMTALMKTAVPPEAKVPSMLSSAHDEADRRDRDPLLPSR